MISLCLIRDQGTYIDFLPTISDSAHWHASYSNGLVHLDMITFPILYTNKISKNPHTLNVLFLMFEYLILVRLKHSFVEPVLGIPAKHGLKKRADRGQRRLLFVKAKEDGMGYGIARVS